MDGVHLDGVAAGADLGVAVCAARRFHAAVAVVGCSIVIITVHIGRTVAICAFHAALPKVNVCQDVFMFA